MNKIPKSLQNYCVKTIVDEFERFFFLFSTSIDDETLRLFDFLQRKYSYDILLYFSDERIEEDYIDFLINKYLTVLDTNWFNNCAWETVIGRLAEIGSNIEKLYLHDINLYGLSDGTLWHDGIEFMPNLKFASIYYECTDKYLKSIAEFCPDILEIHLSNSSVTNDAIKNLCIEKNGKRCCSKLKKLSLESTEVGDEGVKYLIENLPSLEVIVYPYLSYVIYYLHENELSTLDEVKPYNITSLDLLICASEPYFPNLLKVCLSLCPHLKHLTCPFFTEEQLSLFSKLINLEKLHLECCSDADAIDINTLLKSKGEKLSSLKVDYCIVSLSVLAESCPHLKELYLKEVSFLSDVDLKFVFHSLESCVFDTAVDDSGTFEAISMLFSSSPKLETVEFIRCTLSSEMKGIILKYCRNCSVKKLCFGKSDVDIEFLKAILLNCYSLKYLIVEACDVENGDEAELNEFAKILPNNPRVHFLTMMI